MAMADGITITHRIEAPEIVGALKALSEALEKAAKSVVAASIPAQVTTTPGGLFVPCVAPTGTTGASDAIPTRTVTVEADPTMSSVSIAAHAETIPAATSPSPAAAASVENVEPVKAEKTYTFDDITRAGSQLLEMNKMGDLMALLKTFGVQAVTQLKPEQYADVAEGLRKLGAKI